MQRTRQFTINLHPEPEGGYTVLVPALPEVVTYGDTEEEALPMAREAIELALEVDATRAGNPGRRRAACDRDSPTIAA